MKSKPYFCVGCREVHQDEDYCKEDGDLLIIDWDKFEKSVEKIKELNSQEGKK